jgi:single-stranded-DNA-specific exonuclease
MTTEMTLHATGQTKIDGKIIITIHDSYHQGVIGLIAGKLVEQYYLPAIVIAKGETVSKASARSISGFNIIEAIRKSDNLLINAGGHPMAAGFSIETSNITKFKLQILKYAEKMITDEMLEKKLKIDMALDLKQINMDLYNQISRLEPYGNGNPEPVFCASGIVDSVRTVGADGKHLKLVIDGFGAIAFNQGALFLKIRTGDKISFAYSLALDTYNGANKLQLKIKDILR